MSVVIELVGAIEADPQDPAPQLVLADHLLSAEDPRGELIVLDHRDRTDPAGLTDPAALDRILLLAAIYGFPCARDPEPQELLPFVVRGGSMMAPAEYYLDHEGHHYNVLYFQYRLYVAIDHGAVPTGVEYPDGFPYKLQLASSSEWTDEETHVILGILGDAIRAGTPVGELRFPFPSDEPSLPYYPGAPLRCYQLPEEFTAPRGLSRYEHGLAVRDYHRWHGLWRRLQATSPYR